jgi:DNA-binding transcriptional MerR regulator
MSDKLWFKIGEAAAEVGASSHEIRYWEKKIPEIRPRRSSGNIRYYHRDDLPRLAAVRRWTESGFSAADCRAMLLGGHVERGPGVGAGPGAPPTPTGGEAQDGHGDGAGNDAQNGAQNGAGNGAERAPGDGAGNDARNGAEKSVRPAPGSARPPGLEPIIDALKQLLGRLEGPPGPWRNGA